MSEPLVMTPEIARLLREPFPAELVGKLPRIWCGACRESRGKVCDKHQKIRCSGCNNNITTAHLHLDYVGHAETTDRFLQADPGWTWEPVAFDADGLPRVDRNGGLWIRLTIASVTRYGYGHADGKTGPDAVKEAIGDALRNAGMRFGVALDLWGATFKEPEHHDPEPEPALEPDSAQVLRFETLLALIMAAVRSEMKDIGKECRAARDEKQITPVQFDHLSRAAAERLAALEEATA